MFANPGWTVDVTRILTRLELATVLVDAAAGHSNVAITSGYLHVVVDEDVGVVYEQENCALAVLDEYSYD